MRILLVQESDWSERGPHQQHHLIERLQLRGHKVRVIDFEILWRNKLRKRITSKRMVYHMNGKVCKDARLSVIRPSIVKVPLLDYLSIPISHGLEIRRQVAEFRPDVIIGLGVQNTFLAMLMAKRCRIPFVYYLIDALHTLIPFKKLRFLGKFLEKNTLRRCDIVCVINEKLKRFAVEMGAHPKKTHVIRAGIDVERFNPDIDGYVTRAKLGISKDDVVLFFMGWLYPFSGLREVTMELAKRSRVKDVQPKIKFLIVGEGDLYHELQQIKKDCNLQQLILAGRQPYGKIPEYIAASDICLLPAYNNEVMRNIVPIKMYEYMACGKPVIATKLPGIMKEFGEEHGVVYVDKPKDALNKAVELIENKALYECGSKARGFVEKYNWDDIVDEFERVLKDVVI